MHSGNSPLMAAPIAMLTTRGKAAVPLLDKIPSGKAKPSKAAKAKRVDAKTHRGAIKALRGRAGDD